MTLVDDILATLPQLRTEAEGRMVDACTITRAGAGDTTFDPNTGLYTNAADSSIYTGKCEVQVSDGLSAQTTAAGGQVVTDLRVTVKVPMSVENIAVDDVVTITASLLDPDLVGKKYRVIGTFAKSFATARRLQVEEVSL